VWRCACEQIRALDARLEELLQPYEKQLDLLQTIPGVGLIVAATTIATFSDVERIADAKKAASYSGLVPSTYQSGARDA
jgi:transposase